MAGARLGMGLWTTTAQLDDFFLRNLWAQRNEEHIQSIDKMISDVQEARKTRWRAAQMTAVTSGSRGSHPLTRPDNGIPGVPRVDTCDAGLGQIAGEGHELQNLRTRARGGEDSTRMCHVAPL